MLSNRTTRSIGDSIARSAAAARSAATVAGPARTPSARARVRCARNGRRSRSQPAQQGRRRGAPRGAASSSAPRSRSSQSVRGRPDGRERVGAGDPDRERRRRRRRPRRAPRPPRATAHSASGRGSGGSCAGRRGGPSGRPGPRAPRPGSRSTTSATAAPRRLVEGTATKRRGSSVQAWRSARSARSACHVARSSTQDLAGPRRVPPADDVGLLVLEQLVRVEEVLDLDEPVGPDLVEVARRAAWWGSADRDAQDLEVLALVVAHLEAADRAGPDAAAREGRLVDQEERVGVVAVAGPRALDEAVVEVVVDGRGEDAVEPEDAGLLVELVLVAAAARDLDDDLDDAGEVARARGSSRSAQGHRRSVAARSRLRFGRRARRRGAHGNARRNRLPNGFDRGSDEP